MKVLAIDQLVADRPEQPTVPKAVTLEVAPEQAKKGETQLQHPEMGPFQIDG